MVAAPCAIASALHDALGVQFDLPATPDRILAHLTAGPGAPCSGPLAAVAAGRNPRISDRDAAIARDVRV